jgi:hypothetical protein
MSWPETDAQKEYLKSIPSYITDSFFSCRSKEIPHFRRPIFFNPGASMEEGMLKTAISEFMYQTEPGKPKLEKQWVIFRLIFYLFPHLIISYLYLFFHLVYVSINPCAFRKETIPLVVLILIWGMVSLCVMKKNFDYIEKNLTKKDSTNISNKEKTPLFGFLPSKIALMAKYKTSCLYDFSETLNPNKIVNIAFTLVFAIFLVLLGLVLQYNCPDPDKLPSNSCQQEKKNE